MLAPLLTILVSVALGAAVGTLPGALPRVTSPIRTFAVVASLAVVGLHFMPHALESKGIWGLLTAAACFAGVFGVERVTARRRNSAKDSGIGLGLGFGALIIHRIGDGAAMAASSHGPGILWALGAHAVPIVALVSLAYRRHSVASALTHSAALGVASFASFFLVHSLPILTADGFHGFVDAAAAGILVNVVINELQGDAPRGTRERFVDVLSGVAGLALVLGPGTSALEEVQISLVRRFADLAVHTAPMLLIGLAGGALLQALGPRLPERWLSPRSPFTDALRGTIYGAPLPLCSCSVLPLSKSLKQGGAGPALVVAFLISTPELGLETLTLSVQLLGWPFAIFRLAGALVVAFVAGMVVAALTPPARRGASVHAPFTPNDEAPILRRFVHALEDLFLHVGGWILLGLLAAAYADVLIPSGGLQGAGGPLFQLLVVSAIAVPSYVCAPSATPLAAALVAKGLEPGTVLVGLLLGPATNVATLLFLRKSFGPKPLFGMLAAVTLTSWVVGLGANQLLDPRGIVVSVGAHSDSAFELIGLSMLLLVFARTVWSTGIRGWLAASLTDGDAEHGHATGHAHGVHQHAHVHVP